MLACGLPRLSIWHKKSLPAKKPSRQRGVVFPWIHPLSLWVQRILEKKNWSLTLFQILFLSLCLEGWSHSHGPFHPLLLGARDLTALCSQELGVSKSRSLSHSSPCLHCPLRFPPKLVFSASPGPKSSLPCFWILRSPGLRCPASVS
jgi:hypothetical protein